MCLQDNYYHNFFNKWLNAMKSFINTHNIKGTEND